MWPHPRVAKENSTIAEIEVKIFALIGVGDSCKDNAKTGMDGLCQEHCEITRDGRFCGMLCMLAACLATCQALAVYRGRTWNRNDGIWSA